MNWISQMVQIKYKTNVIFISSFKFVLSSFSLSFSRFFVILFYNCCFTLFIAKLFACNHFCFLFLFFLFRFLFSSLCFANFKNDDFVKKTNYNASIVVECFIIFICTCTAYYYYYYHKKYRYVFLYKNVQLFPFHVIL